MVPSNQVEAHMILYEPAEASTLTLMKLGGGFSHPRRPRLDRMCCNKAQIFKSSSHYGLTMSTKEYNISKLDH
ncbi:unnamed protein product [Cuscuta campestris]|uniref:Uncharacterized protein n=1 Tax=Cuscuta campestris TaxID=132261 RepID=A0A484L9G3_9ASTE|nr:unnamed protein product [Cuscuta campestris]